MATGLFDKVYNPDVLSCLANLSNDEVFTPPEVANQMLDMLPQELFESADTTFLDPASKSGVFLREIAKRLLKAQLPGYEDMVQSIEEKKRHNIPLNAADNFFQETLQQKIDHIFHNQLFAIAITELTSLLSRRSVYCSKYPNTDFSVTKFDTEEGNIRFRRVEHGWDRSGKCVFCGASKGQYERSEDLETHAYEWIHTMKPEEIFNMKFDVIISNPPYQLSDGGNAASAIPIYQKFVEQAMLLSPRFLTMIIPSRWFTGGRGLDAFRDTMLHNDSIKELHDFPDASDCFPGVEIKGGVCYFLIENGHHGDCKIVTHNSNKQYTAVRPLLEDGMDVFIRNSQQIAILKKVQALNEVMFSEIISANDPYGFDVREENSYKRVRAPYKLTPFPGSVQYYYNGWRKDGIGYVERKYIRKGQELVDRFKVMVPRVWGSGITETDRVNPFIAGPNSCSTETYLSIGPYDTRETAENVVSYMQTKFFHFMVALVKNTQQAMKKVYTFVPVQDFSKSWTDEELYKKYGLSDDEIAFIEDMIKPMDGGDANA